VTDLNEPQESPIFLPPYLDFGADDEYLEKRREQAQRWLEQHELQKES